jgi:hypothetical protein
VLALGERIQEAGSVKVLLPDRLDQAEKSAVRVDKRGIAVDCSTDGFIDFPIRGISLLYLTEYSETVLTPSG